MRITTIECKCDIKILRNFRNVTADGDRDLPTVETVMVQGET